MASKSLEVAINYVANLSGLNEAIKRTELFERSAEGLNLSINKSTKIIDQNTKVFQRDGKTILQATTLYQNNKGAVQKLTREFEVQAQQIRKNGKFTKDFAAIIKALDSGLNQTTTTSTKALGPFNNVSSVLAKIAGRALLTVPAWQAARVAVSLITNSFAQTVKVMDELDEGVRRTIIVFDKLDRSAAVASRLKTTFFELSAASGIGISEIAKASRELARAGLNAEETIKATEAAVKLMTVTEVEQSTAVKTLVLANNLYGQSLKDAAKGQNTFNVAAAFFSDVADRTVGSLDELFQGFVVFAPTAKQLGLTLEETTGLLAALSNVGFQGTSGGTILNRLFSRSNADIEGINRIIEDFGGTVDRAATPMQRLVTLFQTLNNTDAKRDTIFAAFVNFFGEKGQKGAAFIDELPKFLTDLKRMEGILNNSADSVDRLNEKFQTISDSNKQLQAEIQTGIGGIGQELLKLVTGADNYTSALKKVKELVDSIRDSFDALNDAANAGGFFTALKETFSFIGKVSPIAFAGKAFIQLGKDKKDREARKQFKKEFGNINNFPIPDLSEFNQITSKRFQEKFEKDQASVTGTSPSAPGSTVFKGFSGSLISKANAEAAKTLDIENKKYKARFIFNQESEKNLIQLKAEYDQLLLNKQIIDKTVLAQGDFNAAIEVVQKKLKEITGKDISANQISALAGGGSADLGIFLKGLGIESDTSGEITKLFEIVLQKLIILKQEQDKDHFDLIRREKEKQELQLDNLKTLGYSEEEISALKLKLYENEADFKERQHKLDLQRIDAYQKRIQEVTDSLKSSFQSNFESLFKNEITPSKFLGNIGGTFQDLSIKSTASKATEAILGTGLARQFAEGLEATEQNPIVRSFIEGARRAAPILANSIASGATGTGASAIAGGSGGGVGGAIGGIGGLLGGLFGGNRKVATIGGKSVGLGQTIQGGNTAGGFINAGITGVLTGISSAQRGGKTAGILGGAGGFLTSAAPYLGALGPIGGLVGAGLTIASFFSKKKSVESRTEEQLISIAPKIDVSNRKLELINRNLIALKNVMEQYVLPQSAYYSATTNIADNFSINARRGLV